MDKKINYSARDFEGIKGELISFSEKYYPELSNDFNDSSVGSWFIDLVSAVGDDLNYYIDRCYQENNIDSANLRSTINNIARMNGVKLPGPKSSFCEVQISCVLPLDSTKISEPDWAYAPVIKKGSIVGNGTHNFELDTDVNFAQQFNEDAVSDRTFYPNKNSNNVITSYTVSKTAIAYGSTSRIYKKVLSENEVEPFMEVILPEQNILCVESILFKESSNFKYNPRNYEFFIDEEEFMLQGESINTYRYFEVDSLSEQYRFGTLTSYDSDGKVGEDNVVYDDYQENTRVSRYYKGKWKGITQKFITEYTDNGFLKITFGSGTSIDKTYSGMTLYGKHIASKIMNNPMLGVLPKAGWTMYVMYKVNGGVTSNLAPGSINTFVSADTDFANIQSNQIDVLKKNSVVKSLMVTNLSPSIGGKNAPSIQEAKFLTKYGVSSQKRCVTLKDYKSMVYNIPAKYGCPFRCTAIEENNKIVIPVLNLTEDGKLDGALPKLMADNLVEWLGHFKTITDFAEIRSGKIYNLGFEADVFIDKNYTASAVIASIISKIEDYMNINNHDIGEDVFIGDLEREINSLDGVINLIELRVYNLYGGIYSEDISPLPRYMEYNNSCNEMTTVDYFKVPNNSKSFRIALGKTDNVLYSEYNSMFEVKNPVNDIVVRVKIK